MEQITEVLTLKDITSSARIEYNKLQNAHLLVIDDNMLFALEKKQAVHLFNFINHLHERASLIVTTNKVSKNILFKCLLMKQTNLL